MGRKKKSSKPNRRPATMKNDGPSSLGNEWEIGMTQGESNAVKAKVYRVINYAANISQVIRLSVFGAGTNELEIDVRSQHGNAGR